MFTHRGRSATSVVLSLCAAGLLASGCGSAQSGSSSSSGSAPSNDPVVKQAKAEIAKQMGSTAGYGGPKSGPKAQQANVVAFVASDMTNGGVAGVAKGVEQAAKAIGWNLRVLDGKASVQGRTDAMSQAIALKPAGIILGGFDATEQKVAIGQADAQGIPVVGWHAGPKTGPDKAAGLFTNVTTDPLDVSRLAALYAIAQSDGKAGVVILTDSQFQIAVDKANAMKSEIQKCKGCSMLSYENSPIADAQQRMPSLVSSLLQKYGNKFTYMLAINGNYFSGSRAALVDAGKKGSDAPYAVAAGDGDASEFERIRSADYQAASVAEPLYLQGWQLIDELNRALAHQSPSGYVAPPRLITKADVPTGGVFDPATPYRADYEKIWGVSA